MTPVHRSALRMRLAAGALVVLSPVAPLLAGAPVARLLLGCYALLAVGVAAWLLRRARDEAPDATQSDRRADALEQQVQRFAALLEAGRAVNSVRELEGVLQTILHNAVTIVRARTGSVMLADEDALTVVAAVGNEQALGQRLELGDGIAGRVAMTRAPLLIQGVASASRFPGLVSRKAVLDSAMSIPMVDRGELVGVLNVGAAASREFSTDDMDTLAAFAEHAAAAIAKARLLDASRRATRELAHRATHDALTGLPNRTVLRDRVMEAVSGIDGAPHGALLFLDLDGFKLVNDGFGHAAGDWLLTVAAQRVRDVCTADALAARVGGDEFAVFAPQVRGEAEAATVAQSLLDALRRPIAFSGDSIAFSASVGVALAGRHGTTYDDLMEAADAALYRAKRAGKNRWRVAEAGESSAHRVPRQRRAWSELGDEHVTG